jgi:hypothetical protein
MPVHRLCRHGRRRRACRARLALRVSGERFFLVASDGVGATDDVDHHELVLVFRAQLGPDGSLVDLQSMRDDLLFWYT